MDGSIGGGRWTRPLERGKSKQIKVGGLEISRGELKIWRYFVLTEGSWTEG